MTAFITRVRLENFRNIRFCSVDLHPLTILVGPNGAGKSNFLDAIQFVADALTMSLDHALDQRGSLWSLAGQDGPDSFFIGLDAVLPDGRAASYEIRLGANEFLAAWVEEEWAWIAPGAGEAEGASYRIQLGKVVETTLSGPMPAAMADRLYLVAASGIPDFRPLFDALTRMVIYNPDPHQIREPLSQGTGLLLDPDGENAARVLGALPKARKQAIEARMAAIVAGFSKIEITSVRLQSYLMLEFHLFKEADGQPLLILADAMSDGTLRALALLLAVFQGKEEEDPDRTAPLLVGLEEPEAGLHPAATRVLLDAILEASTRRQILVTSHSTDLLDNPDIPADAIRSVVTDRTGTRIAPLDAAGRDALRDGLFTVGELLRLNQIAPDKTTQTSRANGEAT